MKYSLRILLPYLLFFVLAIFSNIEQSFAGKSPTCDVCNNVTYGGKIQGNETGCGSPGWDPSIITNLEFPTGGSGMMEYMWLFTTEDPTKPFAQWTPIPNVNTPDYDPGVIYKTTYYTRCSRRMGCTEFPGESNIVTKTFNCCNNITSAGKIGSNQIGCLPSFDPFTLTNITLPSGGSGTLVYQWYKSAQNISFDINNPAWVLITGATDSIYNPTPISVNSYYVRLAKRSGCTDYFPSNIVAITLFSPPTVMSSTTPVKCYGESNGAISLVILGGKAPFTFNWNPNTIGNQQNPINLAAGNYSVTVTDANGCSVSKSINLTQPQPLNITFSNIVNNACYGSSNGSANANVTGGTATYSYLWSNGETSQNLTNLASGTYSLTVTDKNGCKVSNSLTITSPPSIQISITKFDNKCYGDSKGQATATGFGGSFPFTYLWSTGSTSNTISNLVSGTYSVTATDANNCTKSTSFTITQPDELNLNLTKNDVKCFGGNNGSINSSVSNGTAPYNYIWSNGSITANIGNLTIGTYSVTVTDENGCKKTSSITISQPTELTVITSKTDVKCNGDNTGIANVSASGGSLPYIYKWSNGGTTSSISNLSAGIYTVTVTDANLCSKISSVTISSPTSLDLQFSHIDVKCHAGNDGTASVSVSGGTVNYTYLWSNGGTTASINNLVAGTYSVTVTDANGCKKTGSVVVNQPTELVVSTSKTDVKCHAGNDGSASVSVSGGTVNYTYLWSNGGTTASINNLAAGTYSVTVTDANGCKKTSSVVVNQPTELVVSTSKTDVKCHVGNDGSASVSVSGGTVNYTYLWSNGGTTASINNLVAGTYSVTVTDANGCKKTGSVVVNQPTELVVSTSKTDVKCNAGNDGIATVSVSGGTVNYTYLWSNGGTTASINNLVAGTYTVTVSDANGCKKTGSVVVNQPTDLVVTTSKSDVKCHAGNDGSASVSVSGGTVNYTYLWSNGGTTASINNLVAGTYTVSVTDANGCKKTSSVVVNQPTELVVSTSKTDVKCYSGNDGSASVSVSGGTVNYTYLWSNGGTTASINNLVAGTYNVTVTDANGCKKTSSVVVNQPTELVVSTSKNDVKCYSGNDGTASVTVSGGTVNYTYLWSNGGTSPTINNLTSGTYTVTVTDANGCKKTSSVVVNQSTELVVSTSKTDVKCYTGNDGSASVSVSGGTVNYTYIWSNGGTTASINNLAAGTYSVTVSDANGCKKTSSVVVNQPTELVVSTNKTDVKCNSGNDGSASVNVSGGTTGYSYIWSNGGTTASINNLAAGIYSVTATDANGCKKSVSIIINESSELVVTSTKTDVKCNGGTDGSASISVSGGTTGYTYIWSNGGTSASINNLAAGTYTVTVIDANGCKKTSSVVVNQPTELVVSTSKIDVKCHAGNDGSASVAVSGGTVNYTYLWSNGGTTASINNLAAGTYSVTVTDANGCKKTSSVVVNQPIELVVSTSKTDVKCYSGNDGSASVTVSGGTVNYSYLWSNGGTIASINNLVAGTYTVTVTDANGCNKTSSVVVNQPTELVVSTSKIDVKCHAGNDGSASVAVSGGTVNYTYLWSNGGTTASINNLNSGIYTVTVTDANGCKKTSSVVVNQPTELVITTSKTDVKCNSGNDGSASVSVSGGTTGYSYLWSNGGTAATINNLSAGTYTVTVSDANGCIKTASVLVNQASSLVSKITKSDVKCYSCKCGSATADASGGTAPYVYTWSNGVNTALNDKIKAGVYYLIITDNNGCKVIDSITINQPTPLELEISKTNIKCNGANDGTASIVAKGGTPPYTFNWTNGQTTTTINNLAPGFYEVTVIDANKCVNYETVEIEEPTILEGNISKTEPKCFGDNSASLTINAVGGTSPYSFNWSTGATTSTISNLVSGTYTVTITDYNGCKKVMSETINDASLLVVKLNKTDVKCHSGNDATITSEVTGGKQTYSYLWNTGATTASLSNLTAGNYSVTVTDANGCTKSSSIEINQPTEILIDLTSVSIKCNGQNTGSIAANVSGGTTGYSYLWSNGATTSSINNLVAGTYSVTITDANGCKKTKSLTLQEPSILDGTITKIDVKCFGGNDGSATATAIGGTAPYSYSWNNGAQTQTINNLKAGKYSVIITDANGCLVKKEIEIIEQSQILVSISKTQLKCANSTDGSATDFANGGKAPYSYKWSNGGNTETITNLGAGVYTVTATDSNGCTATSFITIGAPNPIVISLDKVNISCYGAKDGMITANVTGGTLPIDLLWNTGAITNKISNLSQGIYTITATDANKCIATTSTSILEPTELNVSIYKKDPLCNNGTDGELKATVSGGTSPYVYKWNNGATEQVLKNLPSGTYILTVCDANKCTKVISITLNNPTPIEASLTITNPKCNGDKGTASVNANGGSPNYTYLWSNGETASVNNKLTNGSFSVTITDSKGCTLVKTGEIISPSALVCNATVILKANCTDISTYGGNDGSAKVTTTGGTGNYTYIWSNGSTTSTVNNLSAGSYQVTVSDANGCSCVSSVTLKNPARLGDYVWVDSNRNGIQDNGEAGKQDVLATLTGTDIKGNKITKTVYTDIDGKYIFDGLYDGDYKITFELPVGYKFTKSNAVTNDDIDSDVDATNGMTQIVTIKQGDDVKNLDGGVYKTVNIGNYVWIDSDLNGLQDSSESGINNIKVKLIAPGNDGVFNTSDDIMVAMQNTTNNNGKPGYYLFTDVALGNYCIAFSNLPADYIFTSKDQGTNNAIDSDVDTAGTVKISVIAGQNDDLTIDAGIHLKCNNTIFGGTVGVDQILCGAGQTAATITNLQLPTGGSGTLEYLWLKSTVGPNYVPGDPNWIPISNSNSPDYAPGVLNQTTYFVRCSRRVPCIDYPSESNIITIKVEAIPVADFENFPTGDICVGKKYSISAVDGGVGTSYDWTLNGANPSIANTRVVNDVQWNTIGTYNVKLKVTKNSCVNEKSVNVNVASCINGNIIFGKLNIKLNNSVADLDWTTITPNAENFMFEIEHSDDGRSYRSVGFLNPNNTEIYKFTHTNPTVGTNYYRIKHIAINNKKVYSNTVNTLLKFDQFENFVTYPNPTNNIVVVKPLFDVKQKFTVQVVNTLGQVLQTIEKDPGTTYFEVDLTNYTQGMYLLYFSFDKFKHHTQWILKNDE